jgi:GNAT superfamily N-acetyltransferase
LQEVDLPVVAAVLWRDGLPNLPWQVAAPYLLRLAPPHIALNLESAYAVLSNPTQETIVLRNFIVAATARRQGQGRRLLAALCAAYPHKRWYVPQIFPAEMGAFWEAVGFQRLELHQVQMELQLTPC